MSAAAVSAALLAAAAAVLLVTPPRLFAAAGARPTGRSAQEPARNGPSSARGRGGTDGGSRSSSLLRVVAACSSSLAAVLLVPGATGWLLAVPAGAAVWVRSKSWEGAAAHRRRARLDAQVPHGVDLLAAALAAGAAPEDALARVAHILGGPFEEELREPLTRLQLGSDPAAVWRGLAEHQQLRRLGACLHRATESGAPVADALLRLGEELRAARRADVEARVREVEVRATVPLAACLLPAFVLVGVVPLVAGAVDGLLLR